jgi:hypothetical protein
MLGGQMYQPSELSNEYHFAVVETTAEFWAGAVKILTRRNKKPVTRSHGQRILKEFIKAKVFGEHIKVGPRNYVVPVGYYRQKWDTKMFYKVPLGTKRLSASKL